MNIPIYETRRKGGKLLCRARLTTESNASHYGIPVLEIETKDGDQVYGWSDLLPSGLSAAGFIRAISQPRPENHIPESPERRAALRAALKNITAMGL